MFRLKNLNILGSKAELAALPKGKLLINTINAHSYNTARKDELFAEALTNGDVLIPDGVSIVKACRWIKAKSLPKERIAGWDLFEFEMNKLEQLGESLRQLGVRNFELGVDGLQPFENCSVENCVDEGSDTGNSKLENSKLRQDTANNSKLKIQNSCSGKRLYEPSAKFKTQNSRLTVSGHQRQVRHQPLASRTAYRRSCRHSSDIRKRHRHNLRTPLLRPAQRRRIAAACNRFYGSWSQRRHPRRRPPHGHRPPCRNHRRRAHNPARNPPEYFHSLLHRKIKRIILV